MGNTCCECNKGDIKLGYIPVDNMILSRNEVKKVSDETEFRSFYNLDVEASKPNSRNHNLSKVNIKLPEKLDNDSEAKSMSEVNNTSPHEYGVSKSKVYEFKI